jgi:hypothetical protein
MKELCASTISDLKKSLSYFQECVTNTKEGMTRLAKVNHLMRDFWNVYYNMELQNVFRITVKDIFTHNKVCLLNVPVTFSLVGLEAIILLT